MTNQTANKRILITKKIDTLEYYLIKRITLKKEIFFRKKQTIDNIRHYSIGKSSSKEIDTIISTLGISLPKDSEFDSVASFKKNFDLLNKAIQLKTKKFICIVRNNPKLIYNNDFKKIKTDFFNLLRDSNISYNIIHVDTFFSDYIPLLNSVQKYPFLFIINGKQKLAPIHLKDLSKVIIDLIDEDSSNISIGGPEIINKKDIYKLAYKAFKKKHFLFNVPSLLNIPKYSLTNKSKEKAGLKNQYYLSNNYRNIGEIYLNSFLNYEVKKYKKPFNYI